MQLTEHRPQDHFHIHSLGDCRVRIVATDYRESLLLTPDQGVVPWPVRSFEELSPDALQPVLDYRPDVLLLATGRTQRFPDRELQFTLLRANIGLEVMTLEAAARTFNILA
ncbi:MAG: Mth938-like domain-containing protein, partial [Wenzhouxiangellaceae bacterium]